MRGPADFAREKSLPARLAPGFAWLKRRAAGSGAVLRSKKTARIEVAADFAIEKLPRNRPLLDFAQSKRAEGRFFLIFPGPFPRAVNPAIF